MGCCILPSHGALSNVTADTSLLQATLRDVRVCFPRCSGSADLWSTEEPEWWFTYNYPKIWDLHTTFYSLLFCGSEFRQDTSWGCSGGYIQPGADRLEYPHVLHLQGLRSIPHPARTSWQFGGTNYTREKVDTQTLLRIGCESLRYHFCHSLW